MRHYLNLRILWSEFHEFKTVGPYGMDWANEQYKGTLAHVLSTMLLGSLQGLNLFWLWLIGKVAYRTVVLKAELGDERSDEESEDEEDEVGEIDEDTKEMVEEVVDVM